MKYERKATSVLYRKQKQELNNKQTNLNQKNILQKGLKKKEIGRLCGKKYFTII